MARLARRQVRAVIFEQQLEIGIEKIKDQMAAGHEMSTDAAQGLALPSRGHHVLKTPRRDDGKREALSQVKIRHIPLDQPNAVGHFGPLFELGGGDAKHRPREV
ncbi:hypothetical protein L2331_04135 [Mesorhizobium muleiense]|nr:hypothetical protein [Mesorhizobium muleiense]MCF6109131.1 hypothetical protein [Mesorhizobium muleiense]